jgi:DNA-binding transcriptional LysR family regulator
MAQIAGANRAGEMTVFAQVVEDGSFTAAARSLRLSPSAVSKLVARLEDRLGVRLIQRTTRRLALTAEGRLFHDRCREILDEIAAAEELVAGSRLRPRGTLRVGLSHGFGMSQIVPLVARFAERYPEVELQLAFADRRVDLVAQGLDLAIRLGPVQDEALIARRLCEHGRIVCAAPSYLARHGTPATPADLARHNCILFDQPDYLNRWPFKHPDGTIERVRVRGTARSDSGDALYQLLLNGLGVAWAADFLALPDVAAGRLVPLLGPFAFDERTPVHAVYPQRRHLPAKVRVFIDFLLEQLGPVPPWRRERLVSGRPSA